MRNKKLSHLVKSLDCGEDHKDVTFADIIKTFERRGFGPLLIAPALVTILPTGAIPGVPVLSAGLICLIAMQIIFGREQPWVPETLGNFSIKRKKLKRAIDALEPWVEKLDRIIYPRFEYLTREVPERIIAVLCVALAITMALLGFVPFLPALVSLPVLLFAIGLSLKDGLLTLIGFFLSIIIIMLFPFLFSLVK
jgi:hypothetical protein